MIRRHRRYRQHALAFLAWLTLWVCLPAVAGGSPPIVVDRAGAGFDPWPSTTVLLDPTHTLRLDDVRARASEFKVPAGAASNLGFRRETVWLRIPLEIRISAPSWIFEIGYPSLDRIDGWLVADGVVEDRFTMGRELRSDARPLRSRAHATPLMLEPARRYELYLRVRTVSSVILPMNLQTADGFLGHESSRMLVQGLVLGLLCLLLFVTVVNGVVHRSRVFAFYGLQLTGIFVFLVSYSGLGHQFLWPAQSGLLAKINPLALAVSLIGTSLFVLDVLDLRRQRPRMARIVSGIAVTAAALFVLSLFGVMDYHQTTLSLSLIAPWPLALAIVESTRQARAGHRIAGMMLAGWLANVFGVLEASFLFRGWIPANFVTVNLFQFSGVIEMLVWMQVVAMHIESVRRDAERSAVEKQALQSLAVTDPLTGLPNRRGLRTALEAAVPSAGPRAAVAV